MEKELAERLRRSTREERSALLPRLYDELFQRVPEHPRLARRDDPEESRRAVERQFRLIAPHLDGVETFLEIAPGDCRLSHRVCREVRQVIAADISDQSGATEPGEGAEGADAVEGEDAPDDFPENFRLLLYDGFELDLPEASVDLAFSYQFLEHLHPDDVGLHFGLVHRLLRPGGAYIFDTPHRFSGPWDVSRHFSDEPEGFHLREWTYFEIARELRAAGFSGWFPYRRGHVRRSAAVKLANAAAEHALDCLPRRWERRCSQRLFQSVTVMALR